MIGASADSADIAALVARSGMDARGADGEPATSIEYRVDAERTVRLLAAALAALHATELSDGERRAGLAATDLASDAVGAFGAGTLQHSERSGAYAHMSDERLVDALVAGAEGAAARQSRQVLTHGTPTLSHLWCDHGSVVGLISWDRPAVADPYRDLAVAARCIATDMAPILVPTFFEHYGESSPDPVRIDWYALLAELVGSGGTAPA